MNIPDPEKMERIRKYISDFTRELYKDSVADGVYMDLKKYAPENSTIIDAEFEVLESKPLNTNNLDE